LSEGISVYEERQADPSWGARMSPQFREWILTGRLTPLEEMSGAFLAPETPQHLVFAYFQSSLVIEFLMERGGTPMLRKLLGDLAQGVTANEALERHYGPLNQLDAEFQEYARELARRFGPEIDWTKHDLSAVISNDDPESLVRWVADHPKSWLGLQALAHAQLRERNYAAAKRTLQQLVDLLPEYGGGDAADEGLALCHRELGDPANERLVLEAYVRKADAPVSALRRLIELQTAADDPAALLDSTTRLRAVNPLLSGLHAPAARAAEKLHRTEEAIARWQAELALDPADRADVHYRLAGLLKERDPRAARRQILLALERAPRYRAAQDLLWELATPAVSAIDDLANAAPQGKVTAP
jgi:tetratricopeptide (TPR) repeat protein